MSLEAGYRRLCGQDVRASSEEDQDSMEQNNYLWDRTGEADPEVQQLGEVLGTLRYQPQTLRIPRNIQIGRRRTFFPALAIAAAIVLLAVALGIWFSFNRRQVSQPLQANTGSPLDQKPELPQSGLVPSDQTRNTIALPGKRPTHSKGRHRPSARSLLAANKTRATRTETRPPELTPQELAEKEQMLLALRLVSVKLNLAQRKAQGGAPLKVIRNQHRIG